MNCSDHNLTQLLINRPVAVPSTRLTVDSIFQEFVDQMCRLKTRQTSCCQDDLNSHRSTGLFILPIDLRYNASSELIPTWNLTICMTYCAKISANYIICIVLIDMIEEKKHRLVFVSLGSPKYAIRMGYPLDEKLIIGEGMLNLICTFPGGHWIRAIIQCGHRKVVCFLNKRPQRGRDGHCGNEIGTLRRDIEILIASQPVTYIGTLPQ